MMQHHDSTTKTPKAVTQSINKLNSPYIEKIRWRVDVSHIHILASSHKFYTYLKIEI